MKRLITPVCLLVILGAMLTGCVDKSQLVASGLRIELTGIERSGTGVLTVAWRVANPNVVPYLLTRFSHKIFLNGTKLGTIVDLEPLGVPPNTNAARTSKLTPGDAAGADAVARALASGSASYRIETQIVIRIYDETIEKSSLTNSGTVPVTGK